MLGNSEKRCSKGVFLQTQSRNGFIHDNQIVSSNRIPYGNYSYETTKTPYRSQFRGQISASILNSFHKIQRAYGRRGGGRFLPNKPIIVRNSRIADHTLKVQLGAMLQAARPRVQVLIRSLNVIT
jgi:hypothetical protein